MIKKILAALVIVGIATPALAGTWVKVRGRTQEEAFYHAREQYGKKFVQRGSCTSAQTDGYVYCDALIDE